MTKHNFKVGDKVKIICADKHTSTPSTILAVGRIGKILKLSGVNNIPYTVAFEDYGILNFMEKELELVIKIGQQLEFSFMEGESK